MSKEGKQEFTRSLQQHTITLRAKNIGENLYIQVEDRQNFDKWSRTIDRQFISTKDAIFKDTFSSCVKLFDFLVADFNKIQFEKGILKFGYGVINKASMTACIQLFKQERESLELVELKVDRLEKKQARNQEYVCLMFLVLGYFLLSSRSQISLLEAILEVNDKIGNHPYSPYRDQYSVTATSSKSAIISNMDNEWSHFINKFPILPQIQEIRYTVKILYTQNLVIGFTTEKGLVEKDNSKSPESVYYEGYKSGILWKAGNRTYLSADVPKNGDVVEIYANFDTRKFEWLKEGTIFAECNIPKSMRNKAIYLSIMMQSNNQELEVFV